MKKFIKKLLLNKKGMAIELAILVMLIVVGLSALLVSVSILNKNTSSNLMLNVKERLQLDQIGQSYISAQDRLGWSPSDSDYTVSEISQEKLVLVDSQGNVKLSIKIQNNKITEWKYS